MAENQEGNKGSSLSRYPLTSMFGLMIVLFGIQQCAERYNRKLEAAPVELGYIHPTTVHIWKQDRDKRDGEGIPETYIKVDDKEYLFVYGENNVPLCVPFKEKPASIEKFIQ